MTPCQSISLTSFSYCDVESLIALLLMWSISGYIVAVLSWWILPFLLFFDKWLNYVRVHEFLVWGRLLKEEDDKQPSAKINK